MAFSTDKQTLEDLRIFDKYGDDSIFQLYNRCTTRGGATVLEDIFAHPLSDGEAINRRCNIIRHFAEKQMTFPVTSAYFDAIDPYLNNHDERTKLSAQSFSLGQRLGNMIAADAETAVIVRGVNAMAAMLKEVSEFMDAPEMELARQFMPELDLLHEIMLIPAISKVLQHSGKSKLTLEEMSEYDGFFRFRYRTELMKILRIIYLLDVFLSVARVKNERGFVLPVAEENDKTEIHLEGVYHPALKNAVPNTVHITRDNNVVFLTGANMAGKSTFMKSLSIAVFLAHMGFPVPALRMHFSVMDGIYTTINLPDNLGMGASHFYAEVLRLRKVAQELGQGKRLFIVFDELFRGTNVKDAYEATIAVTEAFAEKRDSIFVLSTHIIEAGDVLKERCQNIAYLYLPTVMNGSQPVYTYKLEQGITNDRHGMIIVNNEKILEILEAGLHHVKKSAASGSLTEVNI